MTNAAISQTSTYRTYRRGLSPMASRFAAVVILLLGPCCTASWAQSVSLHGAGSTFAAPLYKKWIEEYAVSHPNVSLAYDVVGSGEGVKRFLADAVDFAGSD